MAKQGVFERRWRARDSARNSGPTDARHRAVIQLARLEFAFGEKLHCRFNTALAQRDHQRLQKRALAYGNLAKPGVGHRQQALAVNVQGDGIGLSQVDQPGLAVVGIGREDGIGQGPAAQVSLGTRPLPGFERDGGEIAGQRTARAACGEGAGDHAATGDANEMATLHDGFLLSGVEAVQAFQAAASAAML